MAELTDGKIVPVVLEDEMKKILPGLCDECYR